MALTSVARQALFLALKAVVVDLVAASHFRGATIQWKPVDPVNFDGKVRNEYVRIWLGDSE